MPEGENILLRYISASILTVMIGSSAAIAQTVPIPKNQTTTTSLSSASPLSPPPPFLTAQTQKSNLPASKQPSPPAIAEVLPFSTPGVVLINTDPKLWAELNRFNPYSIDLTSPIGFLFATANLGIQDVQSWLGDRVAIALMPATSQKEQSFNSSIVLLAPIKDKSRFDVFFEKIKTLVGQPQIERDYKGVTILRWTAKTSPKEPSEDLTPPEEPEQTPDESTPPKPKPSPSAPLQQTQSHSLLTARSASNPSAEKAVKPSKIEPAIEPEEPATPQTPLPPSPEAWLRRGVAIAILPNSIAIAAQDRALERLINARVAEKTTLAENSLFERTLRHPEFGRSLVVGYGNIGSFSKYLTAFLEKISGLPATVLLPTLEESQIALLTKMYNTFDTHLWLQPEGLHGQTNLYFTTPQPAMATPATPDANQILTRLPGTTFLSANSRNFKRQWQQLTQSAFTSPSTQPILNKVRTEFRQETGLDLEKDIIGWMDGEYAAFYYPTTGGLFNAIAPNFNLGIGFMLQTSDRPAAENSLKKLSQYIQRISRGEAKAVQHLVKGQPVISWEGKDRGKTVSLLAYGWVNDDTVLITTGIGAMNNLFPQPYLPLNLNPNFQTAIASFPNPNEGYVYVNMGASLSFIYSLVLPYVPPEYSPFVEEFQRVIGTVRSISSSNSTTAEAQRFDSLWVLGEARKNSGKREE